ncbi:Rgp1-domain-containing protein [Serendipita vermifera]|nr:Rgp1-domain-containing protein [Serendipita vermifera]
MEITIAPSSSCYFAGEEVRVKITFTNSTAPSTVPRSHRRGHSISSAPLAKPPTSPGAFSHKYAPSSPQLPVPLPSNVPRRRGMIGTGAVPETIAKAKGQRFAPSKSLSTALAQGEVLKLLSEATSSSAAVTKQRMPADKPFPSNHPHARKQSIQWDQAELEHSSTLHPNALPLESISESGTPSPSSPSPSFSEASTQSVHLQGLEISSQAVSSHPRGLGIDFPSSASAESRKGAKSSSTGTLPIYGAETLLWAYAQLSGHVEIEPTAADPDKISAIRSQLKRGGPVGGGSMDLHHLNSAPSQTNEGGWSNLFGSSVRSLVSSGTSPSAPSSFLSSLLSPRLSTPKIPKATEKEDPSDSLITFGPPQSMLVVDLTLMPGESRTYSYAITLPQSLPPTFRGRAFRFTYSLTIGTCRGRVAGRDAHSRLLRVPLRVYNTVSVPRPNITYDLLWPLSVKRNDDFGVKIEDLTDEEKRAALEKCSSLPVQGLFDYSPVNLQLGYPDTPRVSTGVNRKSINNINDAQGTVEEPETAGDSRMAVEILTRQVRKCKLDRKVLADRILIFDIGGVPVAALLMPKTTFRLGETLQGLISLNCFVGGMTVVKSTVLLETRERLPEALLNYDKGQDHRRVQAEQHNDVTLDLKRVFFALDIPSDASPGFNISLDGHGTGGLQWRLRICLLVGSGEYSLDSLGADGEWGSSLTAGTAESLGELEMVECEVPITVVPAHTVFTSTPLSFSI